MFLPGMIVKSDVWFVYDGKCPFCSVAAKALAIKKTVGTLNLIDARMEPYHPVIREIKKLGLDLDEGMVIKFNDSYYHGADSLQVMAYLGTNKGWFNKINYFLFRSRVLGKVFYPLMRGTRNCLLRLKSVKQIKNLERSDKPPIIFKSIFGKQWDKMPPVMHKHYANRAYTDDVVVMEGFMNVRTSFCAKMFAPVFKALGTLTPYKGEKIPVTVRALSSPTTMQYTLVREFRFPNRPAYTFKSVMERIKDNEVVEFMRFGVGWCSAFTWESGKVVLNHKGYVIRLFGFLVPLPIGLILGKGYAEETPLSDGQFAMRMYITHPIWGAVYGYNGTFTVVDP